MAIRDQNCRLPVEALPSGRFGHFGEKPIRDVPSAPMSHLPRSLRQFAIYLAMFAVLLPSVMLMLPAARGQSMAMGEHCDMAGMTGMTGHAQPPGTGNPTAPDQYHECHCLLCVVHAVDVGLPPSIIQWQLSGRADIALAQAVYKPYASAVWLIAEPRGPPVFS
jgi:hypothetical protein